MPTTNVPAASWSQEPEGSGRCPLFSFSRRALVVSVCQQAKLASASRGSPLSNAVPVLCCNVPRPNISFRLGIRGLSMKEKRRGRPPTGNVAVTEAALLASPLCRAASHSRVDKCRAAIGNFVHDFLLRMRTKAMTFSLNTQRPFTWMVTKIDTLIPINNKQLLLALPYSNRSMCASWN